MIYSFNIIDVFIRDEDTERREDTHQGYECTEGWPCEDQGKKRQPFPNKGERSQEKSTLLAPSS